MKNLIFNITNVICHTNSLVYEVEYDNEITVFYDETDVPDEVLQFCQDGFTQQRMISSCCVEYFI